jgi:hypothetical protein
MRAGERTSWEQAHAGERARLPATHAATRRSIVMPTMPPPYALQGVGGT